MGECSYGDWCICYIGSVCPPNYHVSSATGSPTCTACASNSWRAAGDDINQGDTTCVQMDVTTCSPESACYFATIQNDTLCSTISCLGSTIFGNAFCSGAFACSSYTHANSFSYVGYSNHILADNLMGYVAGFEANLDENVAAYITGNAVCSGIGSCRDADIFGNAFCSVASACQNATITHDAICLTPDACNNAHISGTLFVASSICINGYLDMLSNPANPICICNDGYYGGGDFVSSDTFPTCTECGANCRVCDDQFCIACDDNPMAGVFVLDGEQCVVSCDIGYFTPNNAADYATCTIASCVNGVANFSNPAAPICICDGGFHGGGYHIFGPTFPACVACEAQDHCINNVATICVDTGNGANMYLCLSAGDGYSVQNGIVVSNCVGLMTLTSGMTFPFDEILHGSSTFVPCPEDYIGELYVNCLDGHTTIINGNCVSEPHCPPKSVLNADRTNCECIPLFYQISNNNIFENIDPLGYADHQGSLLARCSGQRVYNWPRVTVQCVNNK